MPAVRRDHVELPVAGAEVRVEQREAARLQMAPRKVLTRRT
jgi:hypothetical protein